MNVKYTKKMYLIQKTPQGTAYLNRFLFASKFALINIYMPDWLEP